MNSEIQGTGTLLTELLEAYRGLPRHVQGQVKHLLRESSLQQENYREQNHALVQGGAKYE